MPSTPPVSNAASPYWIVIGDLHDKVARLDKIPGLAGAAGVIVTGDITITGGVAQARKVLEALLAYNTVLFAQIGNMDRAEVTDWLDEQGWNTHLTVRELLPDTAIMGLGGSTFTPFGTPSEFPESRFADWLEEMWRKARAYRLVVLVAHNPPRDTLCDVVGDGTHVGSTAVRDFILEAQPAVCLCGHIHESRAVDQLGRTVLVNPGAFAAGGYAVLQRDKDTLSVSLHTVE
ncbi:MAG: metallophosphoesterase [Bilophila sp.]